MNKLTWNGKTLDQTSFHFKKVLSETITVININEEGNIVDIDSLGRNNKSLINKTNLEIAKAFKKVIG